MRYCEIRMKSKHPTQLFTLAALMAGALTVFGAEVREEFHQTYKLDKTGEVSLENVNGNVKITTWDREEIKVDAIKKAKKQEHLDVVKIDVQSTSEKIRIKTKYPDSKNNNNSTSVDYDLTVPRDSRLNKISNVNGGVTIERVRGNVDASSVNGPVTGNWLAGELHLSTVNGSVKATLGELRKPVSLKSVNGSVSLALPAGANADISADSVNGGISSDFDLKVRKSFPIGQKLEAKLGDGGPEVKLSTVNGGIHIDRAKAGSAENE